MKTLIRVRALKRAQHFCALHVREQPPGSNRGPLIDLWNEAAGVPAGSSWCASFVHAMFRYAGFDLPGGASVQQIRQAARARDWIVRRPRRGDLACFDWHQGSPYGAFGDHVGFVERVLALRWANGTFTGWIQTVEGNTSPQAQLAGSQSDGGGVYRRRRWIRGIGAEFVRVPGR